MSAGSGMVDFVVSTETQNDFSEIMGFIRLFQTTYLKKQKHCSLVH